LKTAAGTSPAARWFYRMDPSWSASREPRPRFSRPTPWRKPRDPSCR
jgi:hypothetical protein